MTASLLPVNDVLVEFTDSCLVRIKSRTQAGTSVKTISFDDYCEAILAAKQSLALPGIVEDTLIYPQDPLVSVVQVRKLETGAEWYFLTREATLFDVQYGDTVFRQVGIPKLLFAIKWAKGKAVAVRVVAVKDQTITENTPIYLYPFSNVMSTDGSICFGANRLYDYDFTDPVRLHSLPHMFLSMPNNNDGYHSRNHSGLELRPLFELLESEVFPDDWLRAAGKTYGQWRDGNAFR